MPVSKKTRFHCCSRFLAALHLGRHHGVAECVVYKPQGPGPAHWQHSQGWPDPVHGVHGLQLACQLVQRLSDVELVGPHAEVDAEPGGHALPTVLVEGVCQVEGGEAELRGSGLGWLKGLVRPVEVGVRVRGGELGTRRFTM